jgi:VanZ family protein
MIRKNLFSILAALLLLYLSLANGEKFQKMALSNIPNIDKIVHFGMYFFLMAVIIIEHRKNIKNYRSLFLLTLFPLLYGILMEILQMTLTSTRSGDVFDALFDAGGILAAVMIWVLLKPSIKESLR